MLRPVEPHETHARLDDFAKSASDEVYLKALNQALVESGEALATESAINPAELPLVYIVGAPRSGATLLSQLCSRYLPLGYINNLIARFWLRPSVGIQLSRILLGESSGERIALTSTHGVTPELTGPHEFGYFWTLWLALGSSRTHHLSQDELARVDREGLRRVLEKEILGAFSRPVVFKNPICGFQASFLTELHPNSLFIHIRRDPYASAASILSCRKERFGTYDAWWSLKPSTWPFDSLQGDRPAEVHRQVMDCRSELETEFSRPGVRSLTVEYQELCENTQEELARIGRAISAMCSSWRFGRISCPNLQVSKGVSLPEELERRLRALFAEDEKL